jgi:hypothetical protein
MIDLSKLFDSYSRQARLFPGLLTLFPIILTAIAWFPRLVTSSWGATLVTVGTSCGLLYGLTVLSRSRGKKVEKRLLTEWGGWPTTIWLRHREEHLPPPVLARYHAFFAKNVPLFVAPNAEQEGADPKAADGMYASAVKWLQERCRGKAFPLVEKENAEYGFRRNMRGLKPIGVAACLAERPPRRPSATNFLACSFMPSLKFAILATISTATWSATSSMARSTYFVWLRSTAFHQSSTWFSAQPKIQTGRCRCCPCSEMKRRRGCRHVRRCLWHALQDGVGTGGWLV